ncbi:MAG: ion channel [Actinomycetota bacterium]
MVRDDDRRALGERVERRFFDDTSSSLDRFGALLFLTVISVGTLSLIDLEAISDDVVRGMASLVLSVTTGATLVLAFRAAGVVRRWRRVAEVVVIIAAVATVIALVVELASERDLATAQGTRPSIAWVLIALISPFAVVHRLLQHRRVTVQTLAGAVSAYLLIAIAACYVFFSIDAFLDDGFFGEAGTRSHEFMYFSLVTITTLGYGDLSPVEPVARLAATGEAVIGQVYLVTFVAMVVGVFIQQRDAS